MPDDIEEKVRSARRETIERTVRARVAFICMAAVVGKEGDLKALTDELIAYCRNII